MNVRLPSPRTVAAPAGVVSVRLGGAVTLGPPPEISVPRKPSVLLIPRKASPQLSKSTIPRRKIKLSPGCAENAMRPCNSCVQKSRSCRVGEVSDSCTECVTRGLSCELAFSEAKLKRVQRKRKEAMAKLKVAIAKQLEESARASRISKEIEFLEREEETLVKRELQNIEEMEEDERRQEAATAVPDDLMFDVSSEQFNFDWSCVAGSPSGPGDTAAEVPGSS